MPASTVSRFFLFNGCPSWREAHLTGKTAARRSCCLCHIIFSSFWGVMKEEVWFYVHLRCNPCRLVRNQLSLLLAERQAEFAEDSTRWCSHTSASTQASWLAVRQPFTGAGAAHPKKHFCDGIPLPRGHTGKAKGAERTLAALPCSRLAPESRALCTVSCRALKSTKSQGLQQQVHKGGPFCIFTDEKKIPYTVIPAMQG